jgi:hypothetical protein
MYRDHSELLKKGDVSGSSTIRNEKNDEVKKNEMKKNEMKKNEMKRNEMKSTANIVPVPRQHYPLPCNEPLHGPVVSSNTALSRMRAIIGSLGQKFTITQQTMTVSGIRFTVTQQDHGGAVLNVVVELSWISGQVGNWIEYRRIEGSADLYMSCYRHLSGKGMSEKQYNLTKTGEKDLVGGDMLAQLQTLDDIAAEMERGGEVNDLANAALIRSFYYAQLAPPQHLRMLSANA